MEPSLSLIFIGLLAVLVLAFVVDMLGRRARVPRPRPFALEAPREAALTQREAGVAQREPVTAQREAVTTPREMAATEAAERELKAASPVVGAVEVPRSLFERVKDGLHRTRANFTDNLASLFSGRKSIDKALLEEIETLLLTADVGMAATTQIIDHITDQLERNQLRDPDALQAALKEELNKILAPCVLPLEMTADNNPFVILVVGVNGVGKTTTIGKLAKRFQAQGKKVMLAAGDTFRAAAVEQLQVWGERNQVPVVAQHTGADSASVIFDAVQSAKARGFDVVIADTAGRLQNKDNLMAELEKVVRVMKKFDQTAPHEVMLVLDAGTGQNALNQAQLFQQVVGVSGVTLTKLDGTAKGGIIFAIAKQLGLPIRFIGVGEQIDDLRPFSAQEFVDALFAR